MQGLTCSNGLVGMENDGGTVCCDIHCDQCGGPGCGNPTLSFVSADDCCASNILTQDEPCSVTGSAPCVLDTVEQTSCSNGLIGLENDGGTVCCHFLCDQCGGPGCGSPDLAVFLSADDCCVSNILENGQLCSVTESSPCVLQYLETCSNNLVGFENAASTVCCDAGCDQCGGTGCGSPTNPSLSDDDCCVSNILEDDHLCSLTEEAPCVLDTAVTCSNNVVGFENAAGTVCCTAGCDQCGGAGCGSPTDPDLSDDDCCASNILENGQPCSVVEMAPCVMEG
eukprot:jgi/Undpi1/12879/HiC_scaffold_7.g02546.m2